MKQRILDFAEIIDALRIIPRVMLLGYFSFYLWYIKYTTDWYFSLTEQTVADTTFVTATITALGGMATYFSQAYLSTGRKWSN